MHVIFFFNIAVLILDLYKFQALTLAFLVS